MGLMETIQNIDWMSFAPAIFASGLSIYNWLKFNKKADIYPGEIVNYGFISSSYHGVYHLAIPLILYNEGAHRGMVNELRIGFESGGKTEWLWILGKAEMHKVTIDQARRFDLDKFKKEGYSVYQPTYPIIVEGFESTSVVMIAQAGEEDGIIPVGVDAKCIVEVDFGRGKTNRVDFPFFLGKDSSETDNMLRWYKSIEKDEIEEEDDKE